MDSTLRCCCTTPIIMANTKPGATGDSNDDASGYWAKALAAKKTFIWGFKFV